MKSSPKSGEMPPSTGSKTPASGKKLVQARLPFKTLGGSEAPPTNDTSDAALATANTPLTPERTDTRKRRKITPATKDDGIKAAKLNRRDKKDEVNESTDVVEIPDSPVHNVTENAKKSNIGRNSESKENVCVDKSADEAIEDSDTTTNTAKTENASKAKQSLEFSEEPKATRKSKRNSEASLIKIKLPTLKKGKAKAKKSKKSNDQTIDNDVSMEEDKPQDAEMDVDDDAELASTSIVRDGDESDDEDDDLDKSTLNASTLNDSIMSNVSDKFATPTANHKLTPRQIQRRLESDKKKEEKERQRIERDRKLQEEKELRQREKDERELQKKREREEKDEQRKKEKEAREQKLLEEKLEKQREKEEKENQKKIEREEKEEQRKREREEKELQKKKEREEKEREREEKELLKKKEREEKEREKEDERKKKEDEKRQKVEAEQMKNRKTAEAFAKFFVPKKVGNKNDGSENDESMDVDQNPQTFVSFQVKENMRIAPVTRRTLNIDERSKLENIISTGGSSKDSYLMQLKKSAIIPRKTGRTLQDDDDEKCSNNDELFIVDDDQGVQLVKEQPKKMYRAKFFKFTENRRPPYYGTWRKKSKTVGPRKPLGKDSRMDYEVDSDDEWEEEEPGESLHGSDDEKEAESEDEYEIDNEFFVPHGHLSDEELEDDEGEFNDPENLKVKLKLAQNELDDERKKKTHKLKPRLIGLIWQNENGSKPDNCSNGVWDLLNKHAMLFIGPSVKVERQTTQNGDSDDENPSKSLGPRRLQIGEKEIPDLIRLINGNQNNSKFLVKEFGAYLAKNNQPQREFSSGSIRAKIKELAIWQACPEEGPLFKKMCWYVPIQTRKRYDMTEPTFPNTWSYTIPPRRPVQIADVDGDKAAENTDTIKKDFSEIIGISDDSNSCTLSETLTPELIKQASAKRAAYNIAKFIRPLTLDEKKKQFEPITLNRRPSQDQVLSDSPSTSQQTGGEKSESARGKKRASRMSPGAAVPKKRINLLMSGPVGQELSPKLKTTLVTQFLSNNKGKRKSTELISDTNDVSSTSTAGTSDGAKKTKLNESVIVID